MRPRKPMLEDAGVGVTKRLASSTNMTETRSSREQLEMAEVKED